MVHGLRWFIAALLALAAILLPPRRASNAEPTLDPAGGPRLLELANAERTERGLPPLVPRADLTDAAEWWALAMARRGELAHDDAGGTQNVVAGDFGVDDLHAGWMASPPHRATILGAYDTAGMGVAVDAEGRWWAVANFAAGPSSPPTTAALPPATTAAPVTTAPTVPPRPVCTCPN